MDTSTPAGTRTKYGCVTIPTTRYEPDTGKTVWVATGQEVNPESAAFQNYLCCMNELDNEEAKMNMEFNQVGAGVGGGFESTTELKPMKYREAMNGLDGAAWREEIENEHERMVKNNVFKVIKKSEMPEGAKCIDSTWACKKKSSGKL